MVQDRRRLQKKRRTIILVLVLVFLIIGAASFGLAAAVSRSSFFAFRTNFQSLAEVAQTTLETHEMGEQREQEKKAEEEENEVKTGFSYDDVVHVETPEEVKALYMTSCAIGTPAFREHVFGLVESTEVNSVVIDIKDYTGTLSFKPRDPELIPLYENSGCGSPYMGEIIDELHESRVYVIGRITVFQDPYYAERHPEVAVQKASDGTLWKDFKGLHFADPGSQQVWDHTVSIAEASYAIGFDELNFDYIRFPSDGPMQDIAFPQSGDKEKADVLEEFFEYLHVSLEESIPGAVTSADLFGMTTVAEDDLNIGQVFERALPYFDYIAPMVYPSHYPPGFEGFADPNTVPYEVVKHALGSAVEKTEKAGFERGKVRTWIQDFDYGGNYGAEEVRAQIQAAYDVGLDSWMIWDPKNEYTREALRAADESS